MFVAMGFSPPIPREGLIRVCMGKQLVEGGVFTPILAFPRQGGRDMNPLPRRHRFFERVVGGRYLHRINDGFYNFQRLESVAGYVGDG